MTDIDLFVTYESSFFPAGGIPPTMDRLPPAMRTLSGDLVVRVTVEHVHSKRMRELSVQSLGVVETADRRMKFTVKVLEGDCPWFIIGQDGGGPAGEAPIFAGRRHPYDMPKEDLIRAALYFGAAVVKALPLIAAYLGVDVCEAFYNLIAQDWTAGTALLAFRSSGLRGSCSICNHHLYDAFVPAATLREFGIDPVLCPGDTILDRTLAIADWASTVSEQFKSDFTEELFLTDVLAPHLQDRLRTTRIQPVNHGPFSDSAIPEDVIRAGRRGDYEAFRAWKERTRSDAFTALGAHDATAMEPEWGDKAKLRRDGSPLVVMAGRDDPLIKNYDLAVAAAQAYLAENHGKEGCARFLFFPVPGDEGLPGLGFLQRFAEKYPEDVSCFPFVWKAGYSDAIKGSTLALLVSWLEPFGSVSEFGGTLPVARATGGLTQQIAPLRSAACFSGAVRVRADRWSRPDSAPSGLLFRERDGIGSAREDFKAIAAAAYDKTGGHPDRLEARQKLETFSCAAKELRIAIEEGLRIYREENDLYCAMVFQGVEQASRNFSWRRAAAEYARSLPRSPRPLP